MFERTLCPNMATGTVIYSCGNDMASGSKNTEPSLSIICVISRIKKKKRRKPLEEVGLSVRS